MMLFVLFTGCIPGVSHKVWPHEVSMEMTDVSLNAYSPMLYFISNMEVDDEAVQHHEIQYHLTLSTPNGFNGKLLLFEMEEQWDEQTLPPSGDVIQSREFHLLHPHEASLELVTNHLDPNTNNYTMIYFEGNGELSGDLLLHSKTELLSPERLLDIDFSIACYTY